MTKCWRASALVHTRHGAGQEGSFYFVYVYIMLIGIFVLFVLSLIMQFLSTCSIYGFSSSRGIELKTNELGKVWTNIQHKKAHAEEETKKMDQDLASKLKERSRKVDEVRRLQ